MTTTPSISAPEDTWLPVMGYPITEPFWAKEPVAVAGQPRAVLVQLFEPQAGAPGGCGEGTLCRRRRSRRAADHRRAGSSGRLGCDYAERMMSQPGADR